MRPRWTGEVRCVVMIITVFCASKTGTYPLSADFAGKKDMHYQELHWVSKRVMTFEDRVLWVWLKKNH